MAFIFRSDHGDYSCATLPDVLPLCRFIPVLFLRNLTIVDCLNTIIEPNVALLVFVLRLVMPFVVDSVVVVSFGGHILLGWLPRLILFPFQNVSNPFTGMPITVWIAGSGHLLVFSLVLQQRLESVVDNLFGCANEL